MYKGIQEEIGKFRRGFSLGQTWDALATAHPATLAFRRRNGRHLIRKGTTKCDAFLDETMIVI